MKPERIQLGLKSLPRWQMQDSRQVLNRTYLFDDFAAAARFVRLSSELAHGQGLRLDFELLGDSLTLRLPSLAEDGLRDEHLTLARAIECLRGPRAESDDVRS